MGAASDWMKKKAVLSIKDSTACRYSDGVVEKTINPALPWGPIITCTSPAGGSPLHSFSASNFQPGRTRTGGLQFTAEYGIPY